MILTAQEFQEWTQHPVTKAFFKSLLNSREELKENLVTGSYDNIEEIKGRCAAVINIVNVNYEDMMEGLNYDK